jgi:hypothetical protein
VCFVALHHQEYPAAFQPPVHDFWLYPDAGIALVLRNLWVWLHHAVMSLPRRGGRVILLERLRWETLLLWLLHAAEAVFGVADTTVTDRTLPYELAG